jgi:SulP family sulfate permease
VRRVVVNAQAIYDIDTTGLATLSRLLDDLAETETTLVLARVRTSVREYMRRTGLEERIGPDNFYLTVADAVRAGTTGEPGTETSAVRD